MISNELPSLYIIGGGRAGASLSFFLQRKGFTILALVERNPDRYRFLKEDLQWKFVVTDILPEVIRDADVIFLTIRDDHIADMAAQLHSLGNFWHQKLVLHCSGALPSSILSPLNNAGAITASLHPVYSFAIDPRENRYLNDVWFNAEGSEQAIKKIKTAFSFLASRIIPVTTEQKKAIHLACVFYSNFYVALAQISRELLGGIGNAKENTFRIFNPLLSSSISQVLEHGPEGALTGPVKRADIDTLQSHLHYIRDNHAQLTQVYLFFSRKLLSISGLPQKDKNRIEQILQQFEQ